MTGHGSAALQLIEEINAGRGLPDHAGAIRFAAVLLRPILTEPDQRHNHVAEHP